MKGQELANEQRTLITRYQTEGLSDEQTSWLIKSFHGIAKTLGDKWAQSFTLDTAEELTAEADAAAFLALKKFDVTRDIAPSTFFYRVMRTTIAKKWHHDRTRCVRVDTDRLNEKTGRPVKLHLQQVSLDSYVEEHGDIDELGFSRAARDVVEFNERLGRLELMCDEDLLAHRVVTRMLDVAASYRRRVNPIDIMHQVACELSVSFEDVEQVIQTIKQHADDDDVLVVITRLQNRIRGKQTDIDVTELVMRSFVDVTEALRWGGHL